MYVTARLQLSVFRTECYSEEVSVAVRHFSTKFVARGRWYNEGNRVWLTLCSKLDLHFLLCSAVGGRGCFRLNAGKQSYFGYASTMSTKVDISS